MFKGEGMRGVGRKYAPSAYTSIKYEEGLSLLSRLASSIHPSSGTLAPVRCKSGGDCIAVLSGSPPEYPGRFIFPLQGYFWVIQEGALPLLIKYAARHFLGDAEGALLDQASSFAFYQRLSAAGTSKALLLVDPVDK